MKNAACLDTGVLGIYFSKNPNQKVRDLMASAQKGDITVYILKPVLVELFYHLCKLEGKEIASIKLTNLLKRQPFHFIDLDDSLILEAGILKCQHKTTLSYIDCMSIAFALNTNTTFHTTEKLIKNIPNNTLQRLKIEKYTF